MSKNILFRGQTRKKGEKVTMSGTPIPRNWVFGGIFPQNNGGDFAIIYQQDPEIQKFPVYAETVPPIWSPLRLMLRIVLTGTMIRT